MLYFNTGRDYPISTSDGRSVLVPGKGEFRGKIHDTFWEFIEPHLENEIVSALLLAQDDVKTFRGGIQKKHLEETQYLLQDRLIRGVYDDMVMVDQNLRGKGSPKKVLLRNIEDKLEKFDKFIIGQVKATQRLLNRSKRGAWLKYLGFFLLGALFMLGLILIDQLYIANLGVVGNG